MSYTYYDLYCDESGRDGNSPLNPPFFLGAIRCTSRRADMLSGTLAKVKVEHGCKGEMKWGNVSERYLSAYKAFLDVFLNDPATRFIWMRVDRGDMWREWERNKVARFFKSYWFFLKANMSTFSRYGVYLDDGPFKRYRYSSMRFAANKGVARSQVHTLEPVDSKEDVLIQLVDVLLGSVSSQAKAPAKVALAHHVMRTFGANKLFWSKEPKFLAYEWCPYEKKVEVKLPRFLSEGVS